MIAQVSSTTGFTQLAREGMKDYFSTGQPQQEDLEKLSWEVTSSYASLSSRESSFKLKKMNLLSNIKILTEKVQKTADLVTFTEEILNGKLLFLSSVHCIKN